MPAIFASMFVVVFVLMATQQRACPRCQALLPKMRKPKSMRQMLFGGWTCSECGCEVNSMGRQRR